MSAQFVSAGPSINQITADLSLTSRYKNLKYSYPYTENALFHTNCFVNKKLGKPLSRKRDRP